MSADQTESATTARNEAPAHGGAAGWYRVAAGFCVLAAGQLGVAAWITMHTVTEGPAPAWLELSLVMMGCAVLLLIAAMLAFRQNALGGLFILIAYAIHAVAARVALGEIPPPSLFMVLAILALIVGRGQRETAVTASRACAGSGS